MTIIRSNPINPDDPMTAYSDWAEDNAGEAAELRGALRTLLVQAKPMLDRLAEMGASGPVNWHEPRKLGDREYPGRFAAECPEELSEIVTAWLEGSEGLAEARDLETFEEQAV